MKISLLSDEKIFKLCQKFGQEARLARQKFSGLLPEVFRRELYKKKGFHSIFHFAAVLAGMSEEQVRVVLNLEKRFEDKPVLQELLVNGEVSVNKLVRVASIATSENQEALAEQVKILSKAAIDTLVKDEKCTRQFEESLSVHSNVKRILENASIAGGVRGLDLSAEVQAKLLELQQKGIDINALLLEFLSKRDMEIAQEKEKIAAELQPTASRYISAKIRAILKKEHGEKCSLPHCPKPAEEIHHTQRFALSKSHNPKFLAPLCHEHHQIAHSIDLKFHTEKTLAMSG